MSKSSDELNSAPAGLAIAPDPGRHRLGSAGVILRSRPDPAQSKKNARAFLQTCRRHEITFFTGVPCSFLADLFRELSGSPRDFEYVAAPREDIAVALACGVQLAGRRAAVLLQNSGLATAINPLGSLSGVYRIPVLLVVGWRGERPEQDAPEHKILGPITQGLLELLSVPVVVLRGEAISSVASRSVEAMIRTNGPSAILVPRGVFGQ